MVDSCVTSADGGHHTRVFVRIPGTTDDASSSSLVINATTISATELLSALETGSHIAPHAAIRSLSSAQLNRTELHRLSNFLFTALQEEHESSAAAALAELIVAHASNPEATFIGLQVLRAWSGDEALREHTTRLREALEIAVREFTFSTDFSRRRMIEIRYVLVRAFESELLHDAAAESIRRILISDHPRLTAERKDLASHIITAANTLRIDSVHLTDLKRLAAAVFATGTAPAALRQAASSESQPKRIFFLVTAQDAERRRQFGLASAIELHKAATLIGRQMTITEYELAITFQHGTSATSPGNQRWFSRDEWLTAHRLSLLAVEELAGDTLAALGLLRLLATKVKVEDPSDSRVSFKRPDALDPLTRRKALREAERFAETIGVSAAQLEAVAEEQAERLFDATFLIHNPSVVSLSQLVLGETEGPSALPKGNSAINLGTSDLTARLLTDSSATLVSRLVAGDFEVLKKAQGLTLSQFRSLLEKIRPRAISDNWARLAFLEIVRAPHADDVDVQVRTAALGALVNEARKLGRLTPTLEKEVFAASAEIPYLPHVRAEAEIGQDGSALADG